VPRSQADGKIEALQNITVKDQTTVYAAAVEQANCATRKAQWYLTFAGPNMHAVFIAAKHVEERTQPLHQPSTVYARVELKKDLVLYSVKNAGLFSGSSSKQTISAGTTLTALAAYGDPRPTKGSWTGESGWVAVLDPNGKVGLLRVTLVQNDVTFWLRQPGDELDKFVELDPARWFTQTDWTLRGRENSLRQAGDYRREVTNRGSIPSPLSKLGAVDTKLEQHLAWIAIQRTLAHAANYFHTIALNPRPIVSEEERVKTALTQHLGELWQNFYSPWSNADIKQIADFHYDSALTLITGRVGSNGVGCHVAVVGVSSPNANVNAYVAEPAEWNQRVPQWDEVAFIGYARQDCGASDACDNALKIAMERLVYERNAQGSSIRLPMLELNIGTPGKPQLVKRSLLPVVAVVRNLCSGGLFSAARYDFPNLAPVRITPFDTSVDSSLLYTWSRPENYTSKTPLLPPYTIQIRPQNFSVDTVAGALGSGGETWIWSETGWAVDDKVYGQVRAHTVLK